MILLVDIIALGAYTGVVATLLVACCCLLLHTTELYIHINILNITKQYKQGS